MHAVFPGRGARIETVLVPALAGHVLRPRHARGRDPPRPRTPLISSGGTGWTPNSCRLGRQVAGRVGEPAPEEDGIDPAKAVLATSADLRYVGQEHFLTLPAPGLTPGCWPTSTEPTGETFGHSNPDELVEIVNLRLTAVGTGAHARPNGSHVVSGSGQKYDEYPVLFRGRNSTTPRFRRMTFRSARRSRRPASSTRIPAPRSCRTAGL